MNRMLFFALGLVMAARAGIAQDASHAAVSPAALRTIVVRAQWLIDGIADKPRHDMEIVIRDNRIVDVRPAMTARRALEQGFTSIRDVETEGAGYGDVGIKRAINEGVIPGPRMWVSTLSISSTGGYPLEGYAPEIAVPKGSQLIDGPVEARKAAREQLDKGADWIKVYMTHRSWLDAQGALVSQPTLTVEELKAIVDETHGWGRKVACHAYNGPGLQR